MEPLVAERAQGARRRSGRKAKGIRRSKPLSRTFCGNEMIPLDSGVPMWIARPARDSANPARRSCKLSTHK